MPSVIRLKTQEASDLGAVPAGKVDIFVDDDTLEPSYKIPAGTVASLKGDAGADAPAAVGFDAGASGAAYEFDQADGDVQELELDDDAAITFTGWPIAPNVGLIQVWFRQPASGGPFAPTFGAEVDWGQAGEPDWSTSPGVVDVVNFETIDEGTRVLAMAVGRAGPAGADGTAGGAISIPYTFSTTTTDSDPGSGNLRLSNATQTSATVIRADLLAADGTDWSAVLGTLADSTNTLKGHIRLFRTDDPTKWLVFSVSALASPSGYKNITVANVAGSSASPFSNGDAIQFVFTRAGDVGASGTASVGSDPIWDAAGDLAQGTGADAAARLAASATVGAHLISQGAATALAWFFGSPQFVNGPASDLSTTSGSPAEISSSLRITATVGPSGVAIAMGSAIIRMGAVTADLTLQVEAGAAGDEVAGAAGWDGVADRKTVPIFYVFTGLTPGSTVFKLYWQTSGGNQAFYDGASRGSAQLGTRWVVVPL